MLGVFLTTGRGSFIRARELLQQHQEQTLYICPKARRRDTILTIPTFEIFSETTILALSFQGPTEMDKDQSIGGGAGGGGAGDW